MVNGPEAAIAENVSRNFGAMKCQECSIALREAFASHGIISRRIRLQAKKVGKYDGIVMKEESVQLPFAHRPGDAISTNGKHYGLEVHGFVYDNIFRKGISAELWPRQFACRSFEFDIDYPDDI